MSEQSQTEPAPGFTAPPRPADLLAAGDPNPEYGVAAAFGAGVAVAVVLRVLTRKRSS